MSMTAFVGGLFAGSMLMGLTTGRAYLLIAAAIAAAMCARDLYATLVRHTGQRPGTA